MPITGCIIVKNEESMLEYCISSFINYVDELIVVDNGSTDQTVAIAKRFPCRIIYAPNISHEGDGRNSYLEAASQPWIFVLDADERITSEGGKAIRDAVANAQSDIMGFALPRFEYFGNGKWARTRMFRLYRNHPEVRYNTHRIHSTPVIAMKRLGTLGEIFAPIHHFDILCNGRTKIKRENNVQKLQSEAKNLQLQADNSDNPSRLHCYLGQEYMALSRYQEAEQEFRISIDLDADGYPRARLSLAQLYLLMGDIYTAEQEAKALLPILHYDISIREQLPVILAEVAIRQGHTNSALQICIQALSENNLSPHMYINAASLLENVDPEKAIEYLDIAVTLNPYLIKPIIYKAGELPNLFYCQSSLLSSVKTIYEHYDRCWTNLGDRVQASRWSHVLSQVKDVVNRDEISLLYNDFLPTMTISPPR